MPVCILRGVVLTALLGALSIVSTLSDVSAQVVQASAPERTMLVRPPKEIVQFRLTDQRGRAFDSAQLRGTPTLVFFGFTNCPDICPVTMQRLSLLKRNHAELAPVKVVMISVDGDRDTPERMATYLAAYSSSFIGLTGKPEAVNRIAQTFSAAFFKGGTKPTGGYDVAHSSQVFLLDASQRLNAMFYDAPESTMTQVIQSVMSSGT